MKNTTPLLFLFLLMVFSCGNEPYSIGNFVQPSNLKVSYDISTSGDGKVSFVATADNAINYHFYYGNSTTEEAHVSPNGTAANVYARPGTQTYNVKVLAYGTGGLSVEKIFQIEVFVISKIPPYIIENLMGGGTKKWVWKFDTAGHLGLGEQYIIDTIKNYSSNWWTAGENEKKSDGCLYDDTLVFTDNLNGTYSYYLSDPGKSTFFRQETVTDALGLPNPSGDQCYGYDAPGVGDLSFKKISEADTNTTGIQMTIGGGGYLSFYLGVGTYEILKLTESELRVRAVQNHSTPESKGNFTWYQTFKATKQSSSTGTGGGSGGGNNISTCSAGGSTGKTGTGDLSTLVWSDEFDTDGGPCTYNWAYETGNGSGGWGNQESQYYTKRPENVFVSNGMLHIVAKKEPYNGFQYTSTRLKSDNLYSFKYGKIQVRAKVPSTKGTWPAAWMLGSNFSTVGWPKCGEIDILEHAGNRLNTINGTLHYPGNSGGNGNGHFTIIPTATTEFHIYEVQWTKNEIRFYVDGNQFHTFQNNSSVPFNHNFFILLNFAMGGTFGGAIDPNFTQDTFFVDYVRVSQ